MTIDVLPECADSPDLVWVGDGAWVACDLHVPASDAAHVVAYVEHKDHRVYVLWVRDRHDVSCYGSLREAVREIALVCDNDAAHVGSR